MNSESSPYKKLSGRDEFNKSLSIPTSKSHANRALIIGALRGNGFQVKNLPESTDVMNLLSAFRHIGLQISQVANDVIFHNSFPSCESCTSEEIIDLSTGDGGTTNRFLIALLARGAKTYRLFPSEKMNERPIEDLLGPLQDLQVSIKLHEKKESLPWITLQGPASMVKTSKVVIDCLKSTQFASAMKLAFSNYPLSIECTNVNASADYIAMTDFVIRQTLQHNVYNVPVDFSSLSYPAALAAVKGEVTIINCHEVDQYQADAKFLDILKSIGTQVSFQDSGLQIKSHSLIPFEAIISQYPDLFPTLVFLAAHTEGTSVFHELDILAYKESDRLKEMLKLLEQFDVDHIYHRDTGSLEIIGSASIKYPPARIKPPRDHRIVMAAALFMLANSGGELAESDCVEKSFPNFFTQLE